MITERDNAKCRNTCEAIQCSSLSPEVKSDLIDCIEEAKMNLNGRNLEERVRSIAQNQFETTRFLANLLIMFSDSIKKEKTPRTWKDVMVEAKWQIMSLGILLAICSIFRPEIVNVIGKMIGGYVGA